MLVCTSGLALARPLVTLHLPQNQRNTEEFGSFGAMVELYLRANLSQTEAVELTSFEQSRLSYPGRLPKIGGYRVEGVYQKVGRLIYLKLELFDPKNQGTALERTFGSAQTADTLAEMGSWLLGQLGTPAQWPKPAFFLELDFGEPLYRLRQRRYETNQLPSIEEVQGLLKELGGQPQAAVIAEINLEMLLAALGEMDRGASLLKRADRMLRKSLEDYPNNGELLALLAFNYQLTGSFPTFVEKAANEAYKKDPRSDLGLFLSAYATGLSTGAGRERLMKLAEQSPNLWEGRLKFMSGALEKELTESRQTLTQILNPDPMFLP
ncbi:MAG: hypothetical protein A2600_01910 [Candidatus Lambdaproteobacteria bacterium RIFOXYD1_FULL_56_27]|uniref:Uncharacterized protein n=1 Tax=Candidatus Lambdaproteobacteria bacterium RIFOXYD2_FULL_56_26 TaxID=1817773 RepID=A0A1F6GMT5_9PROT|nr:MAG: hypothetical protein A2557_12520 [Candidatus Lambdaproteobacteria bacterium RIFOXYD2_FULL_56_26]OGH05595.1 MAG: hypothetical protein A2426_04700 [Candidatus Lambdaproteobacteria bacterium RIFOXYC1_FULL_56_13]OGH08555.1 MAG: hypothetical protein A2600_01910 [Candidatus Lambdaproteobacteria bacterium RIFOXYD1_FULL_56_27]